MKVQNQFKKLKVKGEWFRFTKQLIDFITKLEDFPSKDNKGDEYYNSIDNLIFKIVKKPTKKGDNYYFNIPIDFLRSGKIDLDKEYETLVFDI